MPNQDQERIKTKWGPGLNGYCMKKFYIFLKNKTGAFLPNDRFSKSFYTGPAWGDA